ncbi:MAG: T9SS type A sorting domain-containing protein [Bacteroidia bacterium]|nr:T9SS type A sorting domain-containing protein [Bacteroidia bacterium]
MSLKNILSILFLSLLIHPIYSQNSTKVYSSSGDYVEITVLGVDLIVTPTGGDCTFNRAEIDYKISFHNSSGTTISPITLYTLQGTIQCDNSIMSFSLPKGGGSGQTNTSTSGGHSFINGNCSGYNASFCTQVKIAISGVGIPYQTVSFNYSPLPVELIDFSAEIINNHASLTWTTAQETNNSHFEVFKKIGDEAWKQIGTVQGHGTSYANHTYNFKDFLTSTLTYYSIYQVDMDGSRNHIGYKTIVFHQKQNLNKPVLYPNPFTNEFTVTLPETYNKSTMIQVLNIEGKLQMSYTSKATENGKLTIEGSELAPGVYYIKIISGDNVFIGNLIKS